MNGSKEASTTAARTADRRSSLFGGDSTHDHGNHSGYNRAKAYPSGSSGVSSKQAPATSGSTSTSSPNNNKNSSSMNPVETPVQSHSQYSTATPITGISNGVTNVSLAASDTPQSSMSPRHKHLNQNYDSQDMLEREEQQHQHNHSGHTRIQGGQIHHSGVFDAKHQQRKHDSSADVEDELTGSESNNCDENQNQYQSINNNNNNYRHHQNNHGQNSDNSNNNTSVNHTKNMNEASVENDDNNNVGGTENASQEPIPSSPFTGAPLVCPGDNHPMDEEWMDDSFNSLAQTLKQIQMEGYKAAFKPLQRLSTRLEKRSEQLLEEHQMLKQEMSSYANFIMQQQRAAQDAEAAIQMRLMSRTNTKQRRYISNDNE